MSLFTSFRATTIGSWLSGLRSMYRRYFCPLRKQMGYCHPSATVSRPIRIKGPQNVYLYEDTKIVDATIMTPCCKFIMKKHSAATEGLKVITGNHMRCVGTFFHLIKQGDKTPGFDAGVTVEEDCWIGVNVTLLMGVTVRRGTTVAAGAVVGKSTAPYSIVGGIPAKHIKFYWTIDQILGHEAKLYPVDERYSREELEFYFQQYPR